MFNSKFFAVITLITAFVALCNLKSNDSVTSNEGFLGDLPSMQHRVERVMAPNIDAAKRGNFYSIPGQYQAILNPRFGNTDYGAHIRYKMPEYKNQGVPSDPLSFGNMAKENYDSCKQTKPHNGGPPLMDPDYANGNYHEVMNGDNNNEYPDVTNMLPVSDMTSVNSLGETTQPIVYDRYIYANRNSRLRSHGDPIRGDLPIVPNNSDWFRPSVHPNVDLQTGALAVMGGMDNNTGQEMANLMAATSGDMTAGGLNTQSTMKNISTGSGMADVNVTAFP